MISLRIFIVMLLVCFTLAPAACFSSDEDSARAVPDPVEELDKNLVRANTQFAIDMARQLRGKDPEDDLFFSPASISVALAMTKNGAAAETFDALSQTLGFGEMSREAVNRGFRDLLTILRNPDPEVELDIANSIWAREGLPFKEEFLKANDEYYDATTRELDFEDPAASETINDWVRENTENKIDKIVPDRIQAETIMYLVNAIYFQGEWSEEFDPDLTRPDVFHREGGDPVEVEFMNREGEFPYYAGEDFSAIALPYGDGRVNMYVLLPPEEATVDDLLREMDAESWTDLLESLSPRTVHLSLPRFRLEYENSLVDALSNMGMEVAFDRGRADFSRMYPTSPDRNVYISDVVHKAFVEVDERGTEAAAATSVEMGVTSAPDNTHFVANRPFLFAISDRVTGSIMFLGIFGGASL
ncbi:MAG: serpin family protein [Clostridia bacterium]